MNQCEDRIKKLLPLYTDNELTVEEKVIVDKHVATCSDCMEELKLYKEIHDEFDLDSIKAPKGFHNDLVSKLELLPKKSKSNLYKRYNKYINVAAMLVFVIFLSFLGFTQGNKWGQTSDEAIMNKAEMTSESITEETMKMVMEESAKDTKSEAKMEMAVGVVIEETKEEIEEEEEEETMEILMEDSEEASKEASLDTIIASNKDLEEPTLVIEETEEISDENVTDITFEKANESVENDMNNRGINETDAVSDTDIGLAESEIIKEHKEPLADVEINQTIQTGNPKEDSKTSIFVYMLIIIVSLVIGGSAFYFIRKRILRN